ncbi:DUF2924 domain-containing protein [Parendozoicomonas sp. Alg238-R29]|uniref:DUF2924 domain-containing protein n=1 Tax=Parendozoicomonas sp. Alg238-R29 TaxID=2993446 RepID=UPI00248DBC0C|nr:DUF2924 domain-containing protein [Parendozoicomonas sp. Alg238-R29]
MSDSKNENAGEQTLAAQVAKIMTMNNRQLCQSWKELLGTEAPPLHTKILRQRLAWKVQELASGGLSDKARKRLQQLKMSVIKGKSIRNKRTCQLPCGTRLMREFKGEEHEVIVTAEGFDYRGDVYSSLTKIARKITGSPWNGPAFFGLRKDKKKTSGRGAS